MALFQKASDNQAPLKAKKAQRDDNAARLKIAEGKLTEARANVERLALETTDEARLDSAFQAKRACEDKVAALHAASATLGKEIANIEAAIAFTADQRTRAATADSIVTLAKELGAAAETFDTAIHDLESYLRKCAPLVLDAHGATAFCMSAREQLPPAIAVIADGLKQYRAGVLAGTHRAELPRETPQPVQLTIVPTPMTTIFALQNLKFINTDGSITCIGRNKRHDVPAKLGELALSSGVALPLSDKRIRDLEYGAASYVPEPASCAWLGPKGKEPVPKTARPGPPIAASSLFEPSDYGRRPAVTVQIPRGPEPEPMAATRNAEDDHE